MAARRRTLLLTQREVQRLIDLPATQRAVRQAFIAMARGQATMPAKVYLTLGQGRDFRAMPAWLHHPSAAGLKWVNVHPQNPRHGLPTVMALIVLSDPATGYPLAVMDGLWITKLRTAAAGAVAAKALARPESRVVGLVGCGAQAEAQFAALTHVFRLQHVKVWGYQQGEAQRFTRRMRRRYPKIAWEPVMTVAAAAQEVDLLVTLTPSRRPLIHSAWIRPGTHINAMGADAPGKQELAVDLLHVATVVVDDYEQATHAGEINVAISRRQYRVRDLRGSLGEVLLGRRAGRRSRRDITIFDSTGLAIHDVAVAHAVFQAARRRHIGHPVRFFD